MVSRILFTLLLSLPCSAFAQFIGIPHVHSLEESRTLPLVKVFNKKEAEVLKKLGLDELANAVQIQSEDLKKFPQIKKYFSLDDDASGSLAELFPSNVSPHQWYLKNQGQDQRIILDKYNTGWIQGFPQQDLGVSRIPSILQESNEVRVAVIDTGADWNHPELISRLEKNNSDCGTPDQDLDGNGYKNDCLGWNVVLGNANTQDTAGHGTHVSGLVASVSNGAKIIPIKAIDRAPNAPIRPQSLELQSIDPNADLPPLEIPLTQHVMKALIYAEVRKAQIINMSLSWPASFRSKGVESIISRLVANGTIVVAAAGNDSTTAHVFPCRIEGVVCVGAHGPSNARAHFSNYGPMVDIYAPGQWILSTWVTSKFPTYFRERFGYDYRDGTSMASPLVAGAFAKLLALGFSAEESQNRILTKTRKLSSEPAVYSRIVSDFQNVQATLDVDASNEAGALDLALALQGPPTKRVSIPKKGVFTADWDGISSQLKFEFDADLPQTISCKTRTNIQCLATVSKEQTGHARKVSIQLNFDPTQLPWQIPMTLVDSNQNAYEILVQIFRNLKNAQNTVSRTIPDLSPELTAANAEIFPLRDENQATNDEWVAFLQQETSARFQVFSLSRASAVLSIALPKKADVRKVFRINRQIVFWMRFTPDGQKKDAYRFLFIDEAGKVTKTLDASVGLAPMSENFVWARAGNDFVPAWVSRGLTPDADKPPYDPWSKPFQDVITQRIYTFIDGSVRILKLPDEETPFFSIPETGSFVVGRGSGYELEFFLAEVSNNKITRSPNISGLFRNLGAANQAGTVLGSSQYFFASNTTGGGQHITLLDPQQMRIVRDIHLKPKTFTDNLVRIVGMYSTPDGLIVSAQSHFGLRFYNLDTSLADESTISRFSYLPTLAFLKSFTPHLFPDGTPAVSGFGGPFPGDVQELFIPGRRLARTRFWIPEDCHALGATGNGKNFWLCQNQIIEN